MATRQNRERLVIFRKEITDEQLASISRELHEIDAVTWVQKESVGLRIIYIFPLLCFNTIWDIITRHTDNAQFRSSDKFKYTLIAYMENIEADHLRSYCGWEKYIQDIYVSHHRLHKHRTGQKAVATVQAAKTGQLGMCDIYCQHE